MGADFTIYSFHGAGSLTFPLEPGELPDEFASVPWLQLKEYLFSIGARKNGDKDHLWLDFGDDGTLEVWAHQYPPKVHQRQQEGKGSSEDVYDSIGIDVHTYWTHVHRIFSKALEFDPNLVLFDLQEGIFHNPESFKPLAIEQYEYQQESLVSPSHPADF